MFIAINNDFKFGYKKLMQLTFKVENNFFLKYLINNVWSYTKHKQKFQSFKYCDNCRALWGCGLFGSFPYEVASLPQLQSM
jgi:hypothetical protein